MDCPECGEEIDWESGTCPKCGWSNRQSDLETPWGGKQDTGRADPSMDLPFVRTYRRIKQFIKSRT